MNPGEEPCVLIGAVGAPTAPVSRKPDILRATRPIQSRNGLSAVPFHICPDFAENTLPVCHPVTGGRLLCLYRPGHHDRAHGRDYHRAIAKPSLPQGRAGRRAARLARRERVCGDRSTMSKSETAAIITAQPRGRTRYPAGGGVQQPGLPTHVSPMLCVVRTRRPLRPAPPKISCRDFALRASARQGACPQRGAEGGLDALKLAGPAAGKRFMGGCAPGRTCLNWNRDVAINWCMSPIIPIIYRGRHAPGQVRKAGPTPPMRARSGAHSQPASPGSAPRRARSVLRKWGTARFACRVPGPVAPSPDPVRQS